MDNLTILLVIASIWCPTVVDGKRRGRFLNNGRKYIHCATFSATSQSQHNLGDFCMPGTCASLNSNCKRIGGNAFRCVCKEQYMAINKTHCGSLRNPLVKLS
jgi:hypothetical protein